MGVGDLENHQAIAQGVAVVTGASSGIGRATAVRLARTGRHVLAHYNRNEAGARATQEAIASVGGTSDLVRFCLRDSKAIEKALEEFFPAKGASRPLSILVNNAGLHRDGLAGMMSDEQFNEVVETNVNGSFYLLRWATRRMIRQRTGCIVNVASLAGQTGNPGQINYAASKAALIAMTKSLAMEVGSRGIRVNAVAPGFIETEMTSALPVDKIRERIPLGRFGTADEVAAAIAFLCSPDAAYITGHTLSINGGLFPT